jgi:hypothetical protein
MLLARQVAQLVWACLQSMALGWPRREEETADQHLMPVVVWSRRGGSGLCAPLLSLTDKQSVINSAAQRHACPDDPL